MNPIIARKLLSYNYKIYTKGIKDLCEKITIINNAKLF